MDFEKNEEYSTPIRSHDEKPNNSNDDQIISSAQGEKKRKLTDETENENNTKKKKITHGLDSKENIPLTTTTTETPTMASTNITETSTMASTNITETSLSETPIDEILKGYFIASKETFSQITTIPLINCALCSRTKGKLRIYVPENALLLDIKNRESYVKKFGKDTTIQDSEEYELDDSTPISLLCKKEKELSLSIICNNV